MIEMTCKRGMEYNEFFPVFVFTLPLETDALLRSR